MNMKLLTTLQEYKVKLGMISTIRWHFFDFHIPSYLGDIKRFVITCESTCTFIPHHVISPMHWMAKLSSVVQKIIIVYMAKWYQFIQCCAFICLWICPRSLNSWETGPRNYTTSDRRTRTPQFMSCFVNNPWPLSFVFV